jgi:hypothetical protein
MFSGALRLVRPPPPLADHAVLILRRLASMQRGALNVARAWCAGASSRHAFTPIP